MRFHFKANTEKAKVLLKAVLGIFKIALRLRDRHVFMWKSVEILNVFIALILKQILWKMKTFLKKTGVPPFIWKH